MRSTDHTRVRMKKDIVPVRNYKDPHDDDDAYSEEWLYDQIQLYIEYYLLSVEEKIRWKKEKEISFSSLPSVGGCAMFLVMTKRRLRKYAEEFPETVGEAVERLEDLAEMYIEEGGLTNKLNPSVSTFLLKSKYNHMEQSKREYLDEYRHRKMLSAGAEEREFLEELTEEELETRSSRLAEQIVGAAELGTVVEEEK